MTTATAPAPRVAAPEVLAAIEASLMLDIYNARRRARRRMLGLDPVPEPSAAALELLRRSKAGPSASIA